MSPQRFTTLAVDLDRGWPEPHHQSAQVARSAWPSARPAVVSIFRENHVRPSLGPQVIRTFSSACPIAYVPIRSGCTSESVAVICVHPRGSLTSRATAQSAGATEVRTRSLSS
jgi:hypothetical protein